MSVAALLALLIGIAAAGLLAVQRDAREDIGTSFGERADYLSEIGRSAIASTIGSRRAELDPMLADGRVSSEELEKFRDDFGVPVTAEFDARGKLVAVAPPSLRSIAARAGTQRFVREALAGRATMSDISRIDGEPMIGFAVPYETRRGRRVFVDIGTTDGFDQVFDALLEGAAGVAGGHGVLIDGAGTILSTSGREPLNRTLQDRALREHILAVRGKGSFEQGGMLWKIRPLVRSEGRLAVAGPIEALYAPVNGATRTLPWLYLGALSLAALAMVALLRRVLRSRAQVAAASLAKTEFIASASHELRSPLNGIVGFSQLLRDGKLGEVSEVQAEALDDVLASSQHLLGLISGLLDVTRAETGTIDFQPELIAPAAVLEEVCDALSALAEVKQVELATEIDVSLPLEAFLDATRLRQVLFNFLSNALKHTPARGRVVLRGTGAPHSRFRIEVSDTGGGVAPERQGELFARYAKLDEHTEGSGLGLAVTKQIVEAQGGTVGFAERPGGGSCFFAELPLTHPGARPPRRAVPA